MIFIANRKWILKISSILAKAVRKFTQRSLLTFVLAGKNTKRSSFEINTIYRSKDISQNLHVFGLMFQNSSKVEKVNFYVYFSHDQNSPIEGGLKESKQKNRSKAPILLKSLSFKFGFKTGWASYCDGVGVGQGFGMFVKAMPYFPSPIHFSLTFDK